MSKKMCWIVKCTSWTNKCRVKKEINQANPSIAALEKRWKNIITEVTCGGGINTHMLIVFYTPSTAACAPEKISAQKKKKAMS